MDMELLAKTDEFHDYLSGPATRKILEREYRIYGHEEFRNLSGISVAHLYNLRKRNIRLGLGKLFTKTRGRLSPGSGNGPSLIRKAWAGIYPDRHRSSGGF